MVTHSSILAWGILWTEELGGLQFTGSKKRVGHNLATKQQQQTLFSSTQSFGGTEALAGIAPEAWFGQRETWLMEP